MPFSTDFVKSLQKIQDLTVLWDQKVWLWPSWWPWHSTLEPNKIFTVTMYSIYTVGPWWSCSVTFRGCATGCFHNTVRWSFLLRLGWCFKLFFKSHKLCSAGCLWITVWLLWTATGDTIGLFQSCSCLSGRGIAYDFGRVWCWSPLDLCITLKLVGD